MTSGVEKTSRLYKSVLNNKLRICRKINIAEAVLFLSNESIEIQPRDMRYPHYDNDDTKKMLFIIPHDC